jgi:hypothetical protein
MLLNAEEFFWWKQRQLILMRLPPLMQMPTRKGSEAQKAKFYEVMFFISVMPSEIRRFKCMVSWLCDDHIAADNLRVETSSTSCYDSPLSALSKD